MGNILSDIVDDVDIKVRKNKINFYLKWTLRIAASLIIAAFLIGQLKSKHLNRLDNIEKNQLQNTADIDQLKKELNNDFNILNLRIDKVYDDGFNEFYCFQEYNNKQLEMIIDYGQSNKNLLKRMLEVNSLSKLKSIQNNLNKAKKASDSIFVLRKN